jgi:hypothetical protein
MNISPAIHGQVSKSLGHGGIGLGDGSQDPTAQRQLLETARERLGAGDLGGARALLQVLGPERSNDPETLGLWGALHRRLWETEREPEALDTCVRTSARACFVQPEQGCGTDYASLLEIRALRLAQVGERDDAIADRVYARRAREEVVQLLQSRLDDDTLQQLLPDDAYWLLASAWEALAGLGRDGVAVVMRGRALSLQPQHWMLHATEERIADIRDTQARLALAIAAVPRG